MCGRQFAARIRRVPMAGSRDYWSQFRHVHHSVPESSMFWRSFGVLVFNDVDMRLPTSPKVAKFTRTRRISRVVHGWFGDQYRTLICSCGGCRHASSRSGDSDRPPFTPQKPVKPRRPLPSAVADLAKSQPFEANQAGNTVQPPSHPGFWSLKPPDPASPASPASSPSLNPLPSTSTKTVYYAFFGNTAILLLKGAMWLKSGSSAMMAETLHTFADTLNQALLILGVRQSSIAPDRVHQYGYGRAAFFWGLVSALGLFWCGAGVTIFHGVEKLIHPPDTLVVDTDVWTVLGASLVIDGAVLVRATSELLTRAQAKDSSLRSLGDKASLVAKMRAIYSHLRKTQDPFITAVFLEDFAACLGVCIAGAGIGLTQATGWVGFDSLASISIGAMLGGVAYRLVDMNKRFLLGQAVDAETVSDITRILLDMPSIEFVGEIQTQWVGPSTFAFKAEVDFDGTYLAANLHPRYEKLFLQSKDLKSELPVLLAMYAEDVTRLVERELKEVEDTIRAKHPAAAFIELEPDSKDAELYSVDRAGDVKFQLSEKEKVKRFVALILARRQAKLLKDKQAMLDQASRIRKPEN